MIWLSTLVVVPTRLLAATLDGMLALNRMSDSWWHGAKTDLIPSVGGDLTMDEHGQSISIDVEFGRLEFCREGDTAYVRLCAELQFDGAPDERLTLHLKLPVELDHETVVSIVERCRARIVEVLRSGAALFVEKRPEDLIFRL